MSVLYYQDDELYLEKASLQHIANTVGTPCYVYSHSQIITNWHAFDEALKDIRHRICYAVKANSNLSILKLLANLQSGFDIVSLGELSRVLTAGGNPQKIVFSGVGKSADELIAAIKANIFCFNVESVDEIYRLNKLAETLRVTINIALRLNPNINPYTHSHISTGLKENKFGIDIDQAPELANEIKNLKNIKLIGIACHIGSQITKMQPFLLALDKLRETYQALAAKKITLETINVGGGLGITYQQEQPPSVEEYAAAIVQKLSPLNVEVMIEPGRSIIGNAGILLTKIEYLKHTANNNFAIIDAGMNDYMRPALYEAWQNIIPVSKRPGNGKNYDIAGPVCESADFMGKNRNLNLRAGDLLAIDTAGAYGFSMSSNYNSRCRPAEVMVEGKSFRVIRRRETIKDLLAAEMIN